MALLNLKDIGKIYVSEGNVAVGIRGVNLSFDRGEFVAVTGKSGSGKSTLLNVISGMDSYEEGELFIEDRPTSHFLQKEWEQYREKYISFIFQDYNIIESFTVLQNVELSLMHISDKKERRKRALELLDRVGMTSHIKHKGSKLSGGQKQRTVIARALAKDSPIILADEPTGNLDSVTSAEIIKLLREVSRDKLLIVVTHNFEQVEQYATRHVRIFDGSVESDHVISRPSTETRDEKTLETEESVTHEVAGELKDGKADKKELRKARKAEKKKKKREKKPSDVKNGLLLGREIFVSKPRLSFFLCLLMIIGTLGIFAMTSLCGDAALLFEKSYMFTHIDGRVVLTTRSGEVLSAEQIKELSKKYGAESYMHCDVLLDQNSWQYAEYEVNGDYKTIRDLRSSYGEKHEVTVGRAPEKANEVLLCLPISYQSDFGKNEIKVDSIYFNGMNLTVTGIKYYCDNNIPAKCVYTEEGFKVATATYFLVLQSSPTVSVLVSDEKKDTLIGEINLYGVVPSTDAGYKDKISIASSEYKRLLAANKNSQTKTEVELTSTYYAYNYDYYENSEAKTISVTFDESRIVEKMPSASGELYDGTLIVGMDILCEIADDVISQSYKQVSFFFENDREAYSAAEKMREDGYIAVPSDTTYEPEAFEVILNVLLGTVVACFWLVSIVFLAFFIGLCTNRAIKAFKGDMAIMRSMGIPVKVIRIGMYARMLISLVPAYITVLLMALLIFTTPQFNAIFSYLYFWQYVLIFAGMLLLTFRVTRSQIKKLFKESVKKSLKGGRAE